MSGPDGLPLFNVVSFDKPFSKSGRTPVVFTAMRTIPTEAFTSWLIEECALNFLDRHPKKLVMQRPHVPRPIQPRVAWVGQLLPSPRMFERAVAISRVCGVSLSHVSPRSFAETRSSITGLLPLNGIYLAESVLRRFSREVIPVQVPDSQVIEGMATTAEETLYELRIAFEMFEEEFSSKSEALLTENQTILANIIKPMLAKSKIGQFSHCSKETALTTVRAKHLDVTKAEDLFLGLTEQYSDNLSRCCLPEAYLCHRSGVTAVVYTPLPEPTRKWVERSTHPSFRTQKSGCSYVAALCAVWVSTFPQFLN